MHAGGRALTGPAKGRGQTCAKRSESFESSEGSESSEKIPKVPKVPKTISGGKPSAEASNGARPRRGGGPFVAEAALSKSRCGEPMRDRNETLVRWCREVQHLFTRPLLVSVSFHGPA